MCSYDHTPFFLTLKNFYMARFQLGSMITRISGSIGGTTFRRVGSIDVVSNKSSGASKNIVRNNLALLNIRGVILSWSLLSEILRTEWVSTAELFPIVDKFGIVKTLSGREFFIKYNSQLTVANSYNESPRGFTTVVDIIEPLKFAYYNATERMEFTFNIGGGPVIICLQVFRVSNIGNRVPVNRAKFLHVEKVNDSGLIDLTLEVTRRLGTISSSNNYILQIWCMNVWGVRTLVGSMPCEFA